MPGERFKTTDHDTIRQWTEERGGWPATVKATHTPEDPGILRLDFPDYSGEKSLERISWDEWFDKFDAGKLVLLYQKTTSAGEKSNFNKLVSRSTANEDDSSDWAQTKKP